MNNRRGYFKISKQLLKFLLNLSKDTDINGIYGDSRHDMISIIVNNDKLDMVLGSNLPPEIDIKTVQLDDKQVIPKGDVSTDIFLENDKANLILKLKSLDNNKYGLNKNGQWEKVLEGATYPSIDITNTCKEVGLLNLAETIQIGFYEEDNKIKMDVFKDPHLMLDHQGNWINIKLGDNDPEINVTKPFLNMVNRAVEEKPQKLTISIDINGPMKPKISSAATIPRSQETFANITPLLSDLYLAMLRKVYAQYGHDEPVWKDIMDDILASYKRRLACL